MRANKTERLYKTIIAQLVSELKDDFINESCEETLKLLKDVNLLFLINIFLF